MAIRLLKKSEIASLKAKDRQAEIKQGVELAKRVDNLREVVVEEEKSLAEFRSKTIKSIHAEIDIESAKLSSLKSEVLLLEKNREVGMKEVRAKQKELDKLILEQNKLVIEVDRHLIKVKDKDSQITKQLKEAEKEAQRARVYEQRTKMMLTKAVEDAEETAKLLEVVRIDSEGVDNRKRILADAIHAHNLDMTRREEQLKLKLEQFIKEKEVFAREKTLLLDQYAALAQAKKHLKK